MSVLLNAHGAPEPNSEIVKRLHQIHPDLGLLYNAVTPQHWAVTMQWPKTDRRWELVKTQEISGEATYSILGWLPLDCSLEEAPAYIERFLRTSTSESIRNLTQWVDRFNATAPDAAVEEALTAVLETDNPSETPRRSFWGKKRTRVA